MSDTANFDRIIDRGSVPGEKWGRYAGRDVLPLWVADMDFAAPPAVLAALHARIDHGVFGYTEPWPGLVEAVVDGLARDHQWRIEPHWLVWLPGVVSGFNLACRAVGEPGDEVFLLAPFKRGQGFSEGIDDPAFLERLPPGYSGGIWTDAIDLIAPALEASSTR